MIRWWRVERTDGLMAFELDFDTAAEGEELLEWIVERAELPLLQLFEAGDVVTASPGGQLRFWEGEGGWACMICRDDLDATVFSLRFGEACLQLEREHRGWASSP